MDPQSDARKQLHHTTYTWDEADSDLALILVCPGMSDHTQLKWQSKFIVSMNA